MPPAAGSYNWTQVDAEDGMAGRMSREALILVDGLPEEPDTEPGQMFDYRDGLSSQTAEAVAEIEHETGRSLEFREADAGRGAGYLGIAVEVLGPVATVGGASAAAVQAARLIKWAYHKIASATGFRPMISLGAAEYLAMADLIDRMDSTPHVVGSGDMCSHSPDRDHRLSGSGSAVVTAHTYGRSAANTNIATTANASGCPTSRRVISEAEPRPCRRL